MEQSMAMEYGNRKASADVLKPHNKKIKNESKEVIMARTGVDERCIQACDGETRGKETTRKT